MSCMNRYGYHHHYRLHCRHHLVVVGYLIVIGGRFGPSPSPLMDNMSDAHLESFGRLVRLCLLSLRYILHV